ncbi:3-oxoacyl-[acyl-carrier protein] reductase [Yimella lutea]|uniref:3-oxoacyl-[acyl-carrier protein] reductase n=1 Tax=Yimella lutea TaxID=587872 RepID=A0A542EGN1_9MICO|nr:SDR family oxidoreductase [Yimella lutea]TQJ14497.1 3-oxoacyl-[acyl-carrier protein] reductase [Yimella lutea]
MGDLAGTDSLVLGGSRGIGKAVADCLARDGSRVTIVARTVASAREAAARLPGTGHTGLGIDLREPAQIAAALEPLGAFDIVILNSPGAAPNRVEDTTPEGLQAAFTLMVLSLQRVVACTMPQMKAAGTGRYIAITSSSLSSPIDDLADSSVARAAFASYLALLARHLGSHGITVNHVMPGKVDTERVRAIDASTAATQRRDPLAVRKDVESGIPLGRYAQPREIAELVSFLAGPRASYITGSGLRCDGGLVKSL